MIGNNTDTIQGLIADFNPLKAKVALFKQGDFSFIVEGIANNSEGDFAMGEIATHLKQKKALEILTDNFHEQFLYGGAAGGAKSWTGICWLVFSCLAYPNTNWFIARNQIKDISDSIVKTFKKVCKFYDIDDHLFNYNSIKGYIDFSNGSHINLIEVKFKPSDPMYEDIGSTEYTGGWLEEVGEIHEMALTVLQTRVGRHLNQQFGLKKKLFMTCNPKQNWAKVKFYDKHNDGSLYVENKKEAVKGVKPITRIYLNCLVTENPFIEQDYIDGLRSQALEHIPTYERLFKGNWDYEDNPYQLADQQCIDNIFNNDHLSGGKTYITADIARYGADKAVIMAWQGWVVVELIEYEKSSTQELASAIMYLRNKYRVATTRAIADEDGVGGGVIDYTGIRGFKNGSRAVRQGDIRVNYKNLQVQCLYMLAEIINNDGLWIKADLTGKQKKEIKEELAQIHRVPNTRDENKLDVKSKGDIKTDLGRSPDYRDALLMRVFFELKQYNAEIEVSYR